MKTIIAQCIQYEPEGDYWMQFHAGGRWVPCTVKTEMVGKEPRVNVASGWFTEFGLWPEDEGMMVDAASYLFLGPIPQPEPPYGD